MRARRWAASCTCRSARRPRSWAARARCARPTTWCRRIARTATRWCGARRRGRGWQSCSAVTDLRAKGGGLGVPGMSCDGMDVLDTHAVLSWAVERVRTERRPVLVEAITYRFRGHSMADPEQYRTKEEVARWRERDPIPAFGELLLGAGVL